MKTKNKLIISTAIMAILSIAFTLLVVLVDKQNIGANESIVGLADINKVFKEIFPYCNTFYNITEALGIFVLSIALCYVIVAFVQLIKRKSIKKIDYELLILALFYVGIVLLYIIFELAKINFRPVLLDGELEASYPSSHTMLALFICTTSIFLNTKLIANKKLRITLDILSSTIGLITIIGRIISGVHWITDIIGAIFISTTLVLLYLICITSKNEQPKNDAQKA